MTPFPKTTKFFKTNFNDPIFGLLFLFVPAIVIFAAAYYFLFGRGALGPLIKQSQLRQEAVVYSGTISIEAFLALSRTSLVNLSLRLADDPTLEPAKTQKYLDDFVDSWESTPAVEAIYIDTNGLLRNVSKDKNYLAGQPINVSDRDYVIWSKTAKSGESFIGTVIKTRAGAFKNDYIIPISTPIISNGEFSGTLGLAISINRLTDNFLNPVKITPNSRVYLVDNNGTLLYSPFPETQGVNYIEYLRKNPFIGSETIANKLAQTAANKGSGQLDIILPNQETGSLSRMLIAYQTIDFGNGHWTLAMATPIDDALVFAVPLYLNQLFLISVIFVSLLIMAVYLARKITYLKTVSELKRKRS